jgi:hypothetical protein
MRFRPPSLRTALLVAIIPVTSTCATAGERVLSTGPPARYLQCPPAGPPAQAKFTAGPGGGRLTLGQHHLDVSRGALQRNVTVTLQEVAGDSVGVRIDTEQEPFAAPVRIRIVAHCAGNLPPGDWKIWRHMEGQAPQELQTDRNGRVFEATFERHSGFIIASRT